MIIDILLYAIDKCHGKNSGNNLFPSDERSQTLETNNGIVISGMSSRDKRSEEDSIYKFVYRFIQNQASGKVEQTTLSLSYIH
ncbi:MAG: hypothetical protein CVV33_01405 [Methanomicrobiales archaeon HGW-Methanomicrobiales-4]|nr:MAG: hypothetical protein CVV33_01405 [Methanomicrobiales archaeon HGW-Methanomicrobiales-4]